MSKTLENNFRFRSLEGLSQASHFVPTLIVTTIGWLFANHYWWEGPAFVIAFGIFTTSAIVSVLYLLKERAESRGTTSTTGFLARIPSVQSLDTLGYRLVAFVFPLWTFAVIAGAIWAESAWGRYWGWDPKETWAFITWVIYAGYLHARVTIGWRGRRSATIALVGYAALMFNFVGVNLWIPGLHSYSGLS